MFIIRSTKPCSIAKYTAYIIIHSLTILTIPFINALPIIDFLFYIKLTITITYTKAFITNNTDVPIIFLFFILH